VSSNSVTIRDGRVVAANSNDGDSVVTAPPPPTSPGQHAHSKFFVGISSDAPLDPASFTAGLMLGALLFFILQSAMRWHARREVRSTKRAAAIGPQADDGMAAAVAALARRTATLETIVTDPAQRTAREIEALR
jgi:hypothetical protein